MTVLQSEKEADRGGLVTFLATPFAISLTTSPIYEVYINYH